MQFQHRNKSIDKIAHKNHIVQLSTAKNQNNVYLSAFYWKPPYIVDENLIV